MARGHLIVPISPVTGPAGSFRLRNRPATVWAQFIVLRRVATTCPAELKSLGTCLTFGIQFARSPMRMVGSSHRMKPLRSNNALVKACHRPAWITSSKQRRPEPLLLVPSRRAAHGIGRHRACLRSGEWSKVQTARPDPSHSLIKRLVRFAALESRCFALFPAIHDFHTSKANGAVVVMLSRRAIAALLRRVLPPELQRLTRHIAESRLAGLDERQGPAYFEAGKADPCR